MRPNSLRLLAAALLVLPAAARAQGTLSTQGFGYPTGQLSTRSLGTGGALAEIDPLSATNPAAIYNFGGSALYVQAEPEYRRLTVGNASESSTIARYPLVTASVPLGERFMIGLTASSLLDRTFETAAAGTQRLNDSTLATRNTFKSDGAIGDVRVALAWAPTSWLHLGIAGHAITGDNRLKATQVFEDTLRFASLLDTSTVTYTGRAWSGGAEMSRTGVGSIAASYRRGGSLSLKHADATLSTANVPDRLAFGAAYLGIRGTAIAFRTAKESWSRMKGLGSPGVRIHDGWDTSVGADVLGPRIAGRGIQLRTGLRWRTLPFGIPASPAGGGADVTERSIAFGAGTLLARGRAALDLTGVRATRDATAYGKEASWTLSIGLTVRP